MDGKRAASCMRLRGREVPDILEAWHALGGLSEKEKIEI